MDETLKLLVSAVLGGLLGGGAIYRLFLGALENRMRQTFAARTELDAVGTRVNALETVAIQAREQADAANDRVRILEERHQQQWERVTERLAEQVVRPLERVVERIEKMGEEQVRHGEALKNLYRQIENQSR